jgi:hypothetical protein
LKAQPATAFEENWRRRRPTRRGSRSPGGASHGRRPTARKRVRPRRQERTQTAFRRPVRSIRKIEGIWRMLLKGPIATITPTTVVEAPSRRANATRIAPCVRVRSACEHIPS